VFPVPIFTRPNSDSITEIGSERIQFGGGSRAEIGSERIQFGGGSRAGSLRLG
jgi:hypothetical protein